MEIEFLEELIATDYINVKKHPSAELYIYNYSPKAQYDNIWNEWTLICRGLILDGNHKIVARPFPKFFNLGENQNQIIPDLPFEVFEKMDGSLGILYWIEDEPYIATRGSFTSNQALKATSILKTKYADSISKLEKSKTYLFEIIYPENRIVLDYGKAEKLVLLAIVDTNTGIEVDLCDIGFETVTKYEGLKDLYKLKDLEKPNQEGFVVKFSNGYRIKIKFEEYVRIHRIVTQVSSYNIWEYLKSGQDLLPLLDKVPDEFYDWVKATHSNLVNQFSEIEKVVFSEYKVLESRKETALYFLSCSYPKVMFKMFINKPYDDVIWRMIKPKYERPFVKNEES